MTAPGEVQTRPILSRPVVRQLDALLDLVSPRVGIIKSLSRRSKNDDEPTVPVLYEATLAHFDFRRNDSVHRGSCGKGLTGEEAKLGAIGEAVEHYCGSHAATRPMKRAKPEDLDGAWIPPSEFVLYSERQYSDGTVPFWRWKQHDQLQWMAARELPNGAPVWVPATFIYLTPCGQEPQDFLFAPNSSGLAAGRDVQHALRNGILEVIERDAFMVTWLNRLRVSEIDYSFVRGPIGEIRDTYDRQGVETKAYLLATEMNVTAILAIALDYTGKGPAAVIGLGCDLRPHVALQKAMFELCQMYEPFRKKYSDGAAEKIGTYSAVSTLDDHAAYFFHRDHLNELDFLLESGRKLRLDELNDTGDHALKTQLDILTDRVYGRGERILFCDVTTPELASYPIRVVRALITQMQPIHFGYGMERLGGRRLYELPGKLGFSAAGCSEISLNRCPHPLA